jgi:hypothetical protein
MLVVVPAFCKAHAECSCHELVWRDGDIQIFRLTIASHSSSAAFWHKDDYTFVPLAPQQTLESVRAGETRSPFRKTNDDSNSWVIRDSKIRLVHPRQTEPEEGQVIFNPDDQPYVAMEILSNGPISLPTLSTRLSMFWPQQGEDQKWILGTYAISIQSLAPSEEIKWQPGSPLVLMSASPLKLDCGPRQVSLRVGDLLSVEKDSTTGRNSTTLSARVIVLYKPSQSVLMTSSK